MTQKKAVLNHVKRKGSITAYEALMDHHIVHLPRRIADLIEDGYNFDKEWRTNKATGKRYIRYHLAD